MKIIENLTRCVSISWLYSRACDASRGRGKLVDTHAMVNVLSLRAWYSIDGLRDSDCGSVLRLEECLIDLKKSLLIVDEEIQNDEAIFGWEVRNLDLFAWELAQLEEGLLEINCFLIWNYATTLVDAWHSTCWSFLGTYYVRTQVYFRGATASRVFEFQTLPISYFGPKSASHYLLSDLLNAIHEEWFKLRLLTCLVESLRFGIP